MGELKRVDRKLVYQAHRVKVYEDLMQDESGRQARYDYVENRNGAGILLIDEEYVKIAYQKDTKGIDLEYMLCTVLQKYGLHSIAVKHRLAEIWGDCSS